MARVLVGVPSNGNISEESSQASWLASLHHEVKRVPSCRSGPNFNSVWMTALNMGMARQIDFFCMIHTDVSVIEEEEGKRWVDILVEECLSVDADFVSVPSAIKDVRGVTSCGIGNPANRWTPWRRFVTNEFPKMPRIFNAEMIGYGDKYLIHNHALCIWDMRKPLWYIPDRDGNCRAQFNFTERVYLKDGQWGREVDSEDWAFSRDLWTIGAKTYITSRIKMLHHGGLSYPNWGDQCSFQDGDEDTASQWRAERERKAIPVPILELLESLPKKAV